MNERRRRTTSLLVGDANLEEGTEFEYLQFDLKKKRPQAISDNHEDFASFSLGHLMAWLEGKRNGVRALMISDYKNLITNHMGPPEDFDSFVMSFLLKGPEKWDVLFLDKGERGVRESNLKSPYMQFKNPSWASPYVVYSNHMDSEAGASFYMVSDRFLKQVPTLLKDFRFTMVDGWLSVLCRDGQLKCFSYMQQDWFYGLKTEHLEGHHPPDVREVPTSDILLANGGKPGADRAASSTKGGGGGGGVKVDREIFSKSRKSTLGKDLKKDAVEKSSQKSSLSHKSSHKLSHKSSRKVAKMGAEKEKVEVEEEEVTLVPTESEKETEKETETEKEKETETEKEKETESSTAESTADAATKKAAASLGKSAEAVAEDAMEMMDKEAQEVGVQVEMTAEESAAAAIQSDVSTTEEEAGEAPAGEVQELAAALQSERDTAKEDAAKIGLAN